MSWLTKATYSYVRTKVCDAKFAKCTEPTDNSDSGAVTLVFHGQAPPLSSPNSETRKDSTSARQQATRVTFSANLANAAKRPANMTRKNSISALHWVVRISSAHTVTSNISPLPVSLEPEVDLAHTHQCCDYSISQVAEQSGESQHVFDEIAWLWHGGQEAEIASFANLGGPRAPLRSNFDDPEGWDTSGSEEECAQRDVVHRMAPVAGHPIMKCGISGCTGSCPLSVVENGYKAGKPATCRTCGKTFPRPNVTLSDFFPVKSDKKKGNNSRNVSPATSRRSRNTSPAMSRRSSVVSWSDSPRDQAVPKSEDAVMEDCTESHQAEINRKIRANDKLRKILTNMPGELKSLIYGDSLKAKMQSLDDEKVALLAAKRQFLPLQSRIEKQGRLRRNNNIAWKFYKNGSRLTRNWICSTRQTGPSLGMRCRFWWPNKPQKTRRLSIRALQESSHFHQVPTQTQTHNRPSSQCSNLFSRCKAWGATALRNSSWQLVGQMRKSRKSVRLWHEQCGNWRVGVLSQNQGSKLSNLRAMWWYWTQSSLRAYLVSAAWTSEAKTPSRGACRKKPQK